MSDSNTNLQITISELDSELLNRAKARFESNKSDDDNKGRKDMKDDDDDKSSKNKKDDDDDKDSKNKKDDELKGTNGDDLLIGSQKNDKINGKDGNDEIQGLDGNDKLDGDDGNDLLIGGAGNDDLDGGKDDDILFGGEGNDKLEGGEGNDQLDGGAGNDKLEGDEGDDILFGGDGNDKLEGGKGNDQLDGGAGNDKLEGDEGDDILFGGDGNDKLEGDKGNDTLEGGRGIDDIRGDDGDDQIIWRAGDGEDKIHGGKGNDTFNLYSSNIVQQIIALNTNSEGELVVTLDGGDEGGELTLEEIENFELHIGQAGATIQLGNIEPGVLGDEPLTLGGGTGSDTIDASGSNQAVNIDAGTGDDTVTGGNAADHISGGEGSDIITGGGGDDVIDAGVGNDRVIYRAGDGNDQIDGGEGFDELDMNLHETEPSTLTISADADGNVILVSSDGSQLKVKGIEDILINAGVGGSTITIGDLTGTDIAQDTLYFVGGAGVDNFNASGTDRRINAKGNDGNDILTSGSGNDTLDGGAGDDTLNAGSGQGVDTILGGAGNDSITAVLGDEQGSDATDIVDGGADNDTLNVIFVEPTPHDLILRVSSNGDGSFNVTSEDIDVDEILRVSNVENLQITAGEGALNFVLDSLSDTSLTNGVDFSGSADADFFDASGTDVETRQFGNGGDDNLIGGSENDLLFGGDGNDSLVAGAGGDRLHGDAGNDILDGGSGIDTAVYADATSAVNVDLGEFVAQDTGGAGVDTLVNIENLEGSSFDDTLTGNDADNTIFGGDGNDTLAGGGGFDFLFGQGGNDNLSDDANTGGLLIGGAGDDLIDGDAAYFDDPTGVFVNYSNAAVDVHGDGSLVLASRTARDGYGDTDTFGSNAVNLVASQNDDYLVGSDESNWIRDRAGNDQVHAGGGNDTIVSGSGDDTIDGGDGDDFMRYLDDGVDAAGAAFQGVDVNLATGIAIDGFGDTDTLLNIENVMGSNLADNITGDDNNNLLFARGGHDVVHGGGGNDTLAGWSGHDSLFGGDGDDILIGDTDNDKLTGGSGNDVFVFTTFADGGSNQFGHDTVMDFDLAGDLLNLSPFGIENLADVQAIATDNGTDTTIAIDASNTITLFGITVAQLGAANFIFSEPSEPGITGTDGDDNLVGTPDADTISGGLGNDYIEGLAGNDTIDGGDGQDRVNYLNDPGPVQVNLTTGIALDGYGDIDTLISIEHANGSDYADILIGNDEDNILLGDSGPTGMADTIQGGAGNDSIIGAGGIDIVDGGPGLDVYYYTREGVTFNTPGIEITFETDGSITMFNPNNGDTENITNIEGVVGTIGHDVITGNDQDNFIQGFGGNDIIDGGAGIDTSFNTILGPVLANLETGTVDIIDRPWFGTQLISNFENLMGSSFNDILIGDAGTNILEGLDGDDVLRGGAGNDTLNGGASTLLTNLGNPDQAYDGLDMADYSMDPTAVNVDLGAGTAVDGYGHTDTLISIEGAIGSAGNDVLIGNGADNRFDGRQGDDLITSGAGSDTFILGKGTNEQPDFGLDTVTDFDLSADVVNVRAFGDLQDINDLNISQDGADTLITMSAGNVLRLQGVTATALGNQHFDFAVPLNLLGTEGNDTLVGGDGNDNINGLGGNDNLRGNAGNDFIDGGAGSDSLYGGSGNDTINGGFDNDHDHIEGGAGNDVINAGTGGSYIEGNEGNDTITGSNNWWDHVVGGAGDDVLIDPDGSGFMIGGPGNDSIDGLFFHEDDPDGVIVNLDNNAWDVFGDGSVIVAARTALDGYGDTDTLEAGTQRGHLSHFDDWLLGSEFGGYTFLGDGNDTAFGLGGDDAFRGGAGNDYIDGGDGFDNVNFNYHSGDGGSVATQGVVVNLSGTDFAYSFNGNSGTALANSAQDNYGDTDTIYNVESVNGSVMDDVIIGHDAHNWLWGDEGNDQIYGGGDNDNLIGFQGNDLLDGQSGDWDTAWYNHHGLSNGIHVDLSAGTTFNDGFGTQDTLVSIESVEGSQFNDLIIGDNNNNRLSGNDGDDIIYGGAGNDSLSGRSGNDELHGEAGFDWFDASSGDDLIDGGSERDYLTYNAWTGTTSGINIDLNNIVDAGGYTNVVVTPDGFGGTDYLRNIEDIDGTDHNDTIVGNDEENDLRGNGGDDLLVGGGGHDRLDGGDDNDTLIGGDGWDRLNGGENDDVLTGGAGDDHFSFTRYTPQGDLTSFGQDVITDFSIAENDLLDLYNVPEMRNLNAVQNAATQVGNDVVIAFVTNTHGIDETNSITLQNMVLTDLPNMRISFAPVIGTEGNDNLDAPTDGGHVEGRGGNDILNGSAFQDNLSGGDGDDQLFGNGDNDNLNGGPGADLLDGGDGDHDYARYRWNGELNGVVVDLSTGLASNDGFGNIDTLVNIENVEGTQFNDIITGDANANYIDGREGDDVVHGGAGNDGLRGSEGNDELFGDDGNDWFAGGPGNDLMDGGADSDTVNYDNWTGSTGPITVDLSVVVSAGGYTNVVVVNDTQGGTDYLQNIEGLSGSQFNDNFNGDGADNHFRGNDGNDTLYGNAGNDSLSGGNGDDFINGGAGNDFLRGDAGNDTIDGGDDWDYLAFDQWTGVQQGVNVNLSTGLVSNDGYGSTDTVSNIESVGGSDFNDTIIGGAGDNHLQGRGGNDYLQADQGNDSLQGGDGDDTLVSGGNHANLEGNSGNDTFVLSDGGNVSIGDFVAGAGTEDVIDLAGVAALNNFTEVLAAASDDTLGNTNIDFGNGTSVHLAGVSTASLHPDDFTF